MENQKEIMQMINTDAGRHLLGIKDKFPVVKVSENSFHQLIDYDEKTDTPTLRAEFFASNRILELFAAPITKMKIACQDFPLPVFRRILENKEEAIEHFLGVNEKNNRFPQIYLMNTDFNPNADGGGSGALIRFTGYPGDFTGTIGQSAVQTSVEIRTDSTAYIWRCFYPINTAALTLAAIITAVQFSLYRNDNDGFANNVPGGMSAIVVPNTQASNTALVLEDYDQITRTNKGSKTFASTTNNTYFDMTIADLAFVIQNGYTKLALMTSSDFNQAAPTGGNNILAFAAAGAANPPKLTVTYTLPGGGSLLMLLNN